MKHNGKMIYLAEIEEMTYKEIAKIMKKTEGQVKTNIHRGKQKIKGIFMEGGREDV